jgi:hypothetical protein
MKVAYAELKESGSVCISLDSYPRFALIYVQLT